MTDRNLYDKLSRYSRLVSVAYYEAHNYRIRYADVGEPDKQAVIFIHGAPGSLSAFTGFLKDSKLLHHFRLIAVDRPGYGHTVPGKPVPSIQRQAEILLPLIEKETHVHRPILVGHSYGCPVAAALASETSGEVRRMILVGAAMDPDHEKIFWISYLIALPWIRTLLPQAIHSANMEKLEHVRELHTMRQKWETVRTPVTIIHGRKDWLVPVENAYFARDAFVNAETKLIISKKAGHLIPWQYPELIRDELLTMINPK